MGFNVELFLGDIPQYFKCPLYLQVLQDPRQVCTSQHYACSDCITIYLNRTLSSKKPCPDANCSESVSLQFLASSLFLERALDTLRVRCRVSECKWTGTYNELHGHVTKTCEFSELDWEVFGEELVPNQVDGHDQPALRSDALQRHQDRCTQTETHDCEAVIVAPSELARQIVESQSENMAIIKNDVNNTSQSVVNVNVTFLIGGTAGDLNGKDKKRKRRDGSKHEKKL